MPTGFIQGRLIKKKPKSRAPGPLNDPCEPVTAAYELIWKFAPSFTPIGLIILVWLTQESCLHPAQVQQHHNGQQKLPLNLCLQKTIVNSAI